MVLDPRVSVFPLRVELEHHHAWGLHVSVHYPSALPQADDASPSDARSRSSKSRAFAPNSAPDAPNGANITEREQSGRIPPNGGGAPNSAAPVGGNSATLGFDVPRSPSPDRGGPPLHRGGWAASFDMNTYTPDIWQHDPLPRRRPPTTAAHHVGSTPAGHDASPPTNGVRRRSRSSPSGGGRGAGDNSAGNNSFLAWQDRARSYGEDALDRVDLEELLIREELEMDADRRAGIGGLGGGAGSEGGSDDLRL